MNSPQLTHVEKSLKEQLSCFIGEKLTPRIIEQIMHINIPFVQLKAVVNEIDSTRVDLFPLNIYTALLLDGIKVDYEIVRDVQEYDTPWKRYFMKDGIAYCKNKFIRFEMTVNKNFSDV